MHVISKLAPVALKSVLAVAEKTGHLNYCRAQHYGSEDSSAVTYSGLSILITSREDYICYGACEVWLNEPGSFELALYAEPQGAAHRASHQSAELRRFATTFERKSGIRSTPCNFLASPCDWDPSNTPDCVLQRPAVQISVIGMTVIMFLGRPDFGFDGIVATTSQPTFIFLQSPVRKSVIR